MLFLDLTQIFTQKINCVSEKFIWSLENVDILVFIDV